MNSFLKIYRSKSYLFKNIVRLNNYTVSHVSNQSINLRSANDFSLHNVKCGLAIETKFNSDCIQFVANESILKKYPYIWLRDHCKCSKCYNQITEELENDLTEIPLDVKPIDIKQTTEKSFEITCNFFLYLFKYE